MRKTQSDVIDEAIWLLHDLRETFYPDVPGVDPGYSARMRRAEITGVIADLRDLNDHASGTKEGDAMRLEVERQC